MREALSSHDSGDSHVRELFVTDSAENRYPELPESARNAGIAVHRVTDRAAETLSETVTPQGIVAVCALPAISLADALRERPVLVAVLIGVSDPGNAGTVIRVADAAGAGAVLLAGDSVDPYNGKAIRASTGSLFHLPVARDRNWTAVLAECGNAGLRLVGADGYAEDDLDAAHSRGDLRQPTAWVFGSEAHGLPSEIASTLDATVRVPLYGRAESLNLATASAVCLYASARAQRT